MGNLCRPINQMSWIGLDLKQVGLSCLLGNGPILPRLYIYIYKTCKLSLQGVKFAKGAFNSSVCCTLIFSFITLIMVLICLTLHPYYFLQVTAAIIKIVEKPWERINIDGQPHDHGWYFLYYCKGMFVKYSTSLLKQRSYRIKVLVPLSFIFTFLKSTAENTLFYFVFVSLFHVFLKCFLYFINYFRFS